VHIRPASDPVFFIARIPRIMKAGGEIAHAHRHLHTRRGVWDGDHGEDGDGDGDGDGGDIAERAETRRTSRYSGTAG
jgi:hypothetical protein